MSCEGVELPVQAYLTLTGCTGNDVSIHYDEGTMEWSDDTTNWHALASEETVPTSSSTVYLRGSNVQGAVYSLVGNFTKVAGNVHALINYEDIDNHCVPNAQPCLLQSIYMDGLFGCNESLQDASEFVLPYLEFYYDEENEVGGYESMFQDCTNLTTAPTVLPAITLSVECYARMFSGCTSLTTTPELPATVLAESCYKEMFRNCTSLTTAPTLFATILGEYCY